VAERELEKAGIGAVLGGWVILVAQEVHKTAMFTGRPSGLIWACKVFARKYPAIIARATIPQGINRHLLESALPDHLQDVLPVLSWNRLPRTELQLYHASDTKRIRLDLQLPVPGSHFL
jgi:hypothetical protein